MSLEKTQLYSTAPHLICVDKGPLSLTFHHFGNVRVFNSLNPDLALTLLSLLKVPHTADQISRHCGTSAAEELERLVDGGFVFNFEAGAARPGPTGHPLLEYLSLNPVVREGLAKKLLATKIGIIDFCGLGSELKTLLLAAGFEKIDLTSVDGAGSHDFSFVLGSAQHRLSFSKINQQFWPQKKRWMLVTTDVFGGLVGPTYGSEGGPCFDCLLDQSQRQQGAQYFQGDYTDLIAQKNRPPEDLSGNPLATGVLPFAVTESLKAISGLCKPMSFDGFFSFDLFNFRMNYRPIQPSATCPVCGGI